MSDFSEPNTPEAAPVCKPTKWFLWRAVAMLVMFSVFAVLFLVDGISGYREKNLQYYYSKNFESVGIDFQKKQDEENLTEEAWKEYAAAQKLVFPNDAADVLPKGTSLEQSWPEELVNGYELMKSKGGQNGAQQIWKDYTKKKSWDAEPPHEPYSVWKIKEQFIAAGVAGLLIAITLFFLVRTMTRKITADEEALHTQDGRTIRYEDMVRIDKRKWDTKGLALVYYKDGGEEKKAKIDGMVYGQFKPEDGAPAEKLFSYVMERFKGEVIEYVEEDEEEKGGESGESGEGEAS